MENEWRQSSDLLCRFREGREDCCLICALKKSCAYACEDGRDCMYLVDADINLENPYTCKLKANNTYWEG
jgi:hypothetical protein